MKKNLLIVTGLVVAGGFALLLIYFSSRGQKKIDEFAREREEVHSIISRYNFKDKDDRVKLIISLDEYASRLPDEAGRREAWFIAAEKLGVTIDEITELKKEVKERLEDKKPELAEPPKAGGEYFQEGIELLRGALDKRGFQKLIGIDEGVKATGVPEGIGFLKDVLKKGNITLRVYAAGALLRLGDTSGIDILRYAISEKVQAWQIKIYAAESLAGGDYSEGVEVIEGYLMDSNPWHIRAMAARAGGVVKTEDMKMTLERLLNDPSVYVRIGAAEGLARMGEVDGINYLKEALNTDSTTIRDSAAEALARLGDPSARGYFREQMNSDDKFVKLRAAKNLALTGDYAGMDFIESLLNDEDEGLRFYAASALIEISSKKLM